MSSRCVLCDRVFNSDEALQQHKRDSPTHKFDCIACDRRFRSETALAQHFRDAAVHTQPLEQPSTLSIPPRKRKPSTKPKLIRKWSMYPSLHNDVSNLLYEDNLSFSFYEKDENHSCIDDYDTNIKGQFMCSNQACLAIWTSKQIAITIRRYSNTRYNARVYHQSCKRCQATGEPRLDHSYAERVAYRLKKWSGVVQLERPPYSGQSDGPHRSDLCEGCKQGHCSKMRL